MNQHLLSHTFFAFTPVCRAAPKRLPEKKKITSECVGGSGINQIQFQNNENLSQTSGDTDRNWTWSFISAHFLYTEQLCLM